MKTVTGTYALIPSTNYGTFTGDGSPRTRLVRINTGFDADGQATLTLTTVGTFPTQADAVNEVVFCPGCHRIYLRGRMGEHFATVPHTWGQGPEAFTPASPRTIMFPPDRVNHFASMATLTDPEEIADRRAEGMASG